MRILLAEDVQMVRGALVALLQLQPDFQVVAQVARGDEVLPAALQNEPDVAIIDIDMPGMDGLSAAALVQDRLPGCHTLILTGIEQPGILRRSLELGVTGLMLKNGPPGSLAKAVRDVAAGHRVVDPQIAMAALAKHDAPPLSPREIQILELTSHGNSPKEIASKLFLSPGTVRNHLTSITTKLNARTRVDAVRIAHDAGWIT